MLGVGAVEVERHAIAGDGGAQADRNVCGLAARVVFKKVLGNVNTVGDRLDAGARAPLGVVELGVALGAGLLGIAWLEVLKLARRG